MTQITVPSDIALQILSATSPIVLVDPSGRALVQFDAREVGVSSARFTDADIAEVKEKMKHDDGVRYTWTQVKQHLHSLVGE
ncbi:MAG: hypothetical protein U0805_13330 [Pirellulales bacterium]